MKLYTIIVVGLNVIVLAWAAASARADEGWSGFGPPPVAPDISAPASIPTDAGSQGSTPNLGQGSTQAKVAKGEKGDPGPQGPPGPQGIQGVPGINADLCQNLPGIQTEAGWKRWPQRYWGFKPRLERRVLALNRKGQIVCVTLSWVKKHGRAR